MRKLARILFDESHSQAWTIRPDVAKAIQPSHAEDSSYARAADALRARDFAVDAHTAGTLDAAALDGADVLVLAHPSDAKWEKVVPGGSPVLGPDELDAIEAFVRAGGGLLVLGEEEQDKYGNNLNALLGRFGLRIEHTLVSDYEHNHHAPHWVLGEPTHAPEHGVDVLAGVEGAVFYRSGTIGADTPDARVLARTSPTASEPGAPLLTVTQASAGRVAVLADSDLFGDDCLDDLGHRQLWQNLAYWLAEPAFAAAAPTVASPALESPHWAALKAATDALRVEQEPDGSATDAVAPHVDAMVPAIEGLAPLFPHQADYLAAVVSDLRAWQAGGYAKPDFTRSLELFRPELDRRDGAEHLVVFPMYLQNASRDTRFEALIIRVPWPEWLAELERTRYDNAKFVPVTFVDTTAGYDSECAVLFPETVSVAGKPVNNFGGIFCDRESARFRRVISQAADLLHLNLPPDAAALLASEQLSRDAYLLWDLVHDRAHSHGDLPFDPFMIRQRSPYWMYALEELRCDLTAFGEAVKLEGEGFTFARNVQYAILFDRLFRFPITGPRVRNYDGLGGQLLFAYLHKHGFVHWTDNRLTVEWDRIADGVQALRAMVEELYRSGIDRSKVNHWIAAHELVATYVPPSRTSPWATRDFTGLSESEPKAWIDRVEADEFPLSMFYLQLQGKLDVSAVKA
ncbi:MAG TPA: DUF6421 family protein [Solirubrobacteraceae bacterium]|nr:DUF6421 family protein [Solirubrobacteraceae bacterium]